jgi:predicted amidohydrolase
VRAPLPIAAAQPACEANAVAANAVAHADAVRAAKARVVVFPELSLTGYELDAGPVSPGDAELRPILDACAQTGSVALAGAPVEDAGRRFIAMLRIDGAGAAVAYRKAHLGPEEATRFSAGDGPAVMTVDGWRLGLAICKDTGVASHTAATAALDVDVYVAGVVHLREELGEQDARGRRIAAACRSYVAFASFAGPTGGGYETTAATSTIWGPDGTVVARAGGAPGDLARAVLNPAGPSRGGPDAHAGHERHRHGQGP